MWIVAGRTFGGSRRDAVPRVHMTQLSYYGTVLTVFRLLEVSMPNDQSRIDGGWLEGGSHGRLVEYTAIWAREQRWGSGGAMRKRTTRGTQCSF